METRLRSVTQDNELLKAETEEADYWIFDRGPVKQELLDLRETNAQQTREINRLTRESVTHSENLRTAEAMLNREIRRHPRHELGHAPEAIDDPFVEQPQEVPERSSIT